MTDERSANAVDRRIGQRLKARRLELSISQERLAEMLGVTFQQVQKYEKGVNRVAASRLFDIAVSLGVPVAFFYDGLALENANGVGEEGAPDLVYDTLATPEGQELLTLFGSIQNPRLRRRVVELVRVLADSEPDQDASDSPDDAAI